MTAPTSAQATRPTQPGRTTMPTTTDADRGRYAVAAWTHPATPSVDPTASEVADLVRCIAAYVTAAGGDWPALAANAPGWAAGCHGDRPHRIAR